MKIKNGKNIAWANAFCWLNGFFFGGGMVYGWMNGYKIPGWMLVVAIILTTIDIFFVEKPL